MSFAWSLTRSSTLWLCLAAILAWQPSTIADADEPVFSGPQIGEKLAPFKAKGIFGEMAGKEFDFIERADGKPLLLVFVHARTRPAFGLTNTITRYAVTKAKDGLQTAVIFLTEDPTETEKWLQVVEKQLSPGILYGVSHDGQEGPGSYGLNRNVTLTILVGKNSTVTANLALIQPQLQADGPKIVQAIVDVTGGGKVPSIEELGGDRYGAREQMAPMNKTAGRGDPKLTELLRAVINKQASKEEVEKAAKEVEKYVDDNETARRELARISTTVANSDKLSNYGTEAAQDVLRAWSKKYGAEPKR